MKKNVAGQSVGSEMIVAADNTAFTGAVTVLITKDNGTQTASAGTAPAHKGNGLHTYVATQAETNADHILFTWTGSGAKPETTELYTTFPQSADNPSIDDIWDEDIVSAHTTTDSAGLILSNTRNLSVGAGGIATVADGATVTTGIQTNTYTSTQELDGTTHDVADSAGNTEFYYEFNVGVTGVATTMLWDGHAESNGDSYTVSGYDWVSASFKAIGTIAASNNTVVIERLFTVTAAMTGTGANAGNVRWQVTSSTGTNFSTDRILVEYTALPEAGNILHSGVAQAGTNNTITLDVGANAIDDFYNHARIVISSGTASEQERIIVDYDGTGKVATIAPPWITNPDNTSAFEVLPAIAHAETGWATIKVGVAAAANSVSITLDANASSVNDFYNNDLVHIDAGTGEGQTRVITGYNGTTKVASIDPAWLVTPDSNSEYILEEGHPYITSDLLGISNSIAALNDISVANIFAGGNMDGYTLDESLKLILASQTGKASGMETTTAVIKAADDSKTRITATVDADGNRTSVTLDAS
jgi:hypothetical protein